MKILSGVVQPTSGDIILDGRPVSFASSTEAREHGISIIHQELSLAPNLSVRDNIFMGREIRTATGVDFAEEERQTRALMAELEEEIDPLTPVEDLRLGQQQIVEIRPGALGQQPHPHHGRADLGASAPRRSRCCSR